MMNGEDFGRRLVVAQYDAQQLSRRSAQVKRWKEAPGIMIRELFDTVVKPRLEVVADRLGGTVEGPEPDNRGGWERCRCVSFVVALGYNGDSEVRGQYLAQVGQGEPEQFCVSVDDMEHQAFAEWLETQLVAEAGRQAMAALESKS